MKSKRTYIFVILAMCGLAASSVGIGVNSLGVFYSVVSSDLHLSVGTFTLHVTLSMIICSLTGILVGRILNSTNYKMLVSAGMVLSFLSCFLMGSGKNITQFLLLGFLKGIGNGLTGMVVQTMVINQWFHRKHGLITSLVFSFAGITGAICSPLFSALIESNSWHSAYRVVGIVSGLLCLPAVLLPHTYSPTDMNLSPYGDMTSAKNSAEERSSLNLNVFAYLLTFAVMVTGITSLTQHLPNYAASIAVSAQVGAIMVSMVMIGNILSKLLIGEMSDRIGAYKATKVMLLVNLVSIILMLSLRNSIALMAASALFGSIYSISAVSIALLTKEFYSQQDYSRYYPFISFGSNAGAALSVSIYGYAYDFFADYRACFLLAIVLNVSGLLLLNLISVKKRQLYNGRKEIVI